MAQLSKDIKIFKVQTSLSIYFEEQKTVVRRGEGLFKPVPLNDFAPDIAKELIFKNVV